MHMPTDDVQARIHLLNVFLSLAPPNPDIDTLAWARHTLQQVGCDVNNLDIDWRDGIRLCALTESLQPGSCPNFDRLNPSSAVVNSRFAMKRLQKYLAVPKVLVSNECMRVYSQTYNLCCF